VNELEAWSIARGVGAPPPQLLDLSAGQDCCGLEGGDVWHYQFHGIEAVRRIYVAVRNIAWDTLPAALSPVTVTDSATGGVRAVYQASVAQDEIALEWTGAIELNPDGELTYTMSGQANSGFPYARVGLNVLHPPSIAGCQFVAHTAEGRLAGSMPIGIGPQPFIDGQYLPLLPAFSRLSLKLQDDTRVDLEFEGDTFEIEDQRNWLDASYKSYSTPMSLGVLRAEPGQRFFQRVRVTVSRTAGRRGSSPDRRKASGRTLRVGDTSSSGTLPMIGLGLPADGGTLTLTERNLLSHLPLDHLRVDLRMAGPGTDERIARAAEAASACGCGLEIALIIGKAPEDELAQARVLLKGLGAEVRRFLIFGEQTMVTPPALLNAARRVLGATAPIFGGTNLHFAELNRDRPEPSSADGFAFSANPQVHATDDRSLLETPATFAEMLRTARGFCGDRPIAVSPITLLPRFNPDAPQGESGPDEDIPPADHRQASLLCAVWTLSCVKYLADGAAESVTFFETSGDRGVMARQGGESQLGCLQAGAAFPVYSVLATLASWAGRSPLQVRASDELSLHTVACMVDTRLEMIVANTTPDEFRLGLEGLPEGAASMRLMDAEAVLTAWNRKDQAGTLGHELELQTAPREVSLGPYAVAFLAVAGR
jgi:hypothetical protein